MRNLIVGVVVLGAGGYFGAKYYVQHKTAKDLDAMLDQVRPFVDVTYDDVVATMGGELRIEDVTVRMPQFKDDITIESAGLQTPGFLFLLGFDRRNLEVPERLGIALRGMRFDARADFVRELEKLQKATPVADFKPTPADECATSYGSRSDTLRQLGYREVVADLEMGFRQQDSQVVMSFGMAVTDMYEVDVELTLDGLSDPTQVARGARPLLAGGRLDYVDRSLNDRIMKYCTGLDISTEDILAAQLREAHRFARQYGMELDELIIQPYTDFLLGKQRFTLIAEPPRPVDLTQLSLYKPSDVPNLLNLTAETG